MLHATAARTVLPGDISKPAFPVEVRVLLFAKVSEGFDYGV